MAEAKKLLATGQEEQKFHTDRFQFSRSGRTASAGSNSCFYDGKIVVKNVKAGGYILGDEGSGAVLGKMFLSDVLKGLAPKDVMADFFEKFRIRQEHFAQHRSTALIA